MSNDLSFPSPERFGLSSFADILPKRGPITGEDPGSFTGFHEGMIRALTPFTPYECVIAENLISIEWELIQHRRMRDVSLRAIIQEAVRDAVLVRKQALHFEQLDAAWAEHVEQGGTEDDWVQPFYFHKDAAVKLAGDFALRSVSSDPDVQAAVHAEIVEMGLDPVKFMSDAYLEWNSAAATHDAKIQGLERRRREVKRDYDALQKARPLDGEIIEG